jgi:hypothetical protein
LFIVNSGQTFVVNGLTFANGGGVQYGGAIDSGGTALTVVDSTFDGNFASKAGGAISDTSGTFNVSGSTFVNNVAGESAGAIFENTGSMTITNSTFKGNTSRIAGGIQSDAPATVTNSTLDDNLGQEQIAAASGNISLGGDIIVNNPRGSCSQTVTDLGYNLTDSDGTACGFSAGNNDLVSTDPQLQALANNGGKTQTEALPSSSPAPST